MLIRRLLLGAAIGASALLPLGRPAGASYENVGYASLVVNVTNDQPLIDWSSSLLGAEGSGGITTVSRVGTGRYTFVLNGIKSTKIGLHLTSIHDAFDIGDDPLCVIRSTTTTSTSTKVTVNCFNAVTGKAAPGRHFQLVYSSDRFTPAGEVGADLIRLQTTSTSSHTIPSSKQHRSDYSSARTKVKRLSRGIYRVTVPGAGWGLVQGNVVTSAIASSARWCNPYSWGSGGQTGKDLLIEVHCFKPLGLPADSKFAMYATRTSVFDDGHIGASQAVTLGTKNGPLTFIANRFNSGGGDNVAEWNEPYETTLVWFTGLPIQAPKVVMVSAIHDGSARCSIAPAPVVVPHRSVKVRCVDPFDVPVKAPFSVMDTNGWTFS